jgi:hypothetical protein
MLRDTFFYIKRTSKFFRETLRFLAVLFRDYRQKKGNKAGIRIALNGYSSGQQKDWFCRFVEELTGQQVAMSWYKPTIIFSSSFGSYWLLKILLLVYKQPSIFFSEENLTTLKKYREYKSYLDGQPSLAMGFDYCIAENYRRFPLWLLYIFPPDFAAKASIGDIQKTLEKIEKQSFYPKTKFAAMVASHDGYACKKKVYGCLKNSSRSVITKQVSSISFVYCPGKLLHNDDSLQNEYNNDKQAYLKQFVFNICAENASVKGYVTEKIFQAIEGGTIPIYWGDENPEPNVLNHERVIFWEESRSENILETIEKLYLDEETRKKFLQQSVFTDCAANEIHNYFLQLRKDLAWLIIK